MKECKHCGAENTDSAKFCEKCVKQLSEGKKTSDSEAAFVAIIAIVGIIVVILVVSYLLSAASDIFASAGWVGVIILVVALVVVGIIHNK